MGTPQEDVRLRRIDASCNMARFYVLSLQPTLFGEVSLVREWGRIGTKGQYKIKCFDLPDHAHQHMRRLEARKRRRGYVEPSKDSEERATPLHRGLEP